MAGKRLKKKQKKHKSVGWLLVPAALLAAAMVMIPLSGSAVADQAESIEPEKPGIWEEPEESAEVQEPLKSAAEGQGEAVPPAEPEEVKPWNVRLPSVSANDPTTPQKHYWEQQVEESDPVDNAYFADAAFLGDSRTEGFHLYSGLKEGYYFHSVGATVESVFSKKVGREPLLDSLARVDVHKIYICLGANELGWVRKGTFAAQYGKLIDRVRADHPDAQILLQSILPVTAAQDAKGSYVNNRRIENYNLQIRRLAMEKDCLYVNAAEAVTGADGCLPEEISFDGVHLNPVGCRMWLDYLKTHTK